MAYAWQAVATENSIRNKKSHITNEIVPGGSWIRLAEIKDPQDLASAIIRVDSYATVAETGEEQILSTAMFSYSSASLGTVNTLLDMSPINYSSSNQSLKNDAGSGVGLKWVVSLKDDAIFSSGSGDTFVYSYGIMSARVETIKNGKSYLQGFFFTPEIDNIFNSYRVVVSLILADNIKHLSNIEIYERDFNVSESLLDGQYIYGYDSEYDTFLTYNGKLVETYSTTYLNSGLSTEIGFNRYREYFSIEFTRYHDETRTATVVNVDAPAGKFVINALKNSIRYSELLSLYEGSGYTTYQHPESQEPLTAEATLKIKTLGLAMVTDNGTIRKSLKGYSDDDIITFDEYGEWELDMDNTEYEITVQIPKMFQTFVVDDFHTDTDGSFTIKTGKDPVTLYRPYRLFSVNSTLEGR